MYTHKINNSKIKYNQIIIIINKGGWRLGLKTSSWLNCILGWRKVIPLILDQVRVHHIFEVYMN